MKIKWPHSHRERGRTVAEGRWNQPAPARVDILGTNVPNAVPRASPSHPPAQRGRRGSLSPKGLHLYAEPRRGLSHRPDGRSLRDPL